MTYTYNLIIILAIVLFCGHLIAWISVLLLMRKVRKWLERD